MKKVTAIFTSDWHLRDDQPPCRTDDFEKAQWGKVAFIASLQKECQCPVFHAGDLFHHWKPSPYLLSKTIQHLPDQFFSIYGNHDLPQHNVEMADRCGLNVLMNAGKVVVLNGNHWGVKDPVRTMPYINGYQRSFMMWHTMTYQGKIPFPGCADSPARALVRKYPDINVILTGHNHQAFTESFKNTILVNPGCITRQESDQGDFLPRVYLYYGEMNMVEPVFLPVDKGVVTTPISTVKQTERNERIDAFISRLDTDWVSSIDYEKNVLNALDGNELKHKTRQIILNAIKQ